MEKQMTRVDMVESILDAKTDGFTPYDLRQLLQGGCKGLGMMTDKELAQEYWDIFGECLEDEGYIKAVVIEEA